MPVHHAEIVAVTEIADRLDTWCMTAREAGVFVAIHAEAHRGRDFGNLRFGFGQARQGRLAALRRLLRH